MTVKELIEQLEGCVQDLNSESPSDDISIKDVEVKGIEQIDAY